MKHRLLLAAALLLATSALADSPDAILKDYRTRAAQAVERLNFSLKNTATPLITKLVSSGDTDGAALLTSQLKDKLAGEPVPTPQASAAPLFSLYDEAIAKALVPVQKSSIARIDSLLKTAGSPKLETVTELGKVRAEIEAGKVSVNNDQLFVGKSYYTKAGSEYHFNKDGTGYRLQKMDFDDKVAFTWTQRSDGVVEALQRKQPTAPPSPTFFRFVDKKTSFQGDSPANITTLLIGNK
jgi:hypothetical protein